jgi:valyl-tRNA synthetase
MVNGETMPDNYDPKTVEKKWQDWWEAEGIYHYDFDSSKPTYSIDNPPRYASGPLHAGHAVHYTHIDFAARYHRMKGLNVFFPLCFDVNGMPIEVNVEKKFDIHMRDTDRQEFIKMCREFAQGNIGEMTRQFKILGESMDPTIYYQTDAEYYRRVTQVSFIKLFNKGLVYKGEFPINWCTRCGTALAESEVEYRTRMTKLNYINFTMVESGEKILIATTRPELLCTCHIVAVHPDDPRSDFLSGRMIRTPIYDKEVRVMPDDAVLADFGTGIVMVCSIGDKDDLEWIRRYDLQIEKGIDENGKMTEVAGKYQGMSTDEAKQAIIQDMKDQGILVKQEDLEQNVGCCWRCKSPIEFLVAPQWFLKTLDFKEEVLARSDEIKWFPQFMKIRLEEWVNSLSWDWVLSRQRYFATPIPVWECISCNKAFVPKEEDCYIDPTVDDPPVLECDGCGGPVKGCDEVFDTWMDSSLTPLFNSFWQRDDEKFSKLWPMSMRPQSHDIIRTWAFYTILRSHLLVDSKPWEEIMMGGFILAEDGTLPRVMQ